MGISLKKIQNNFRNETFSYNHDHLWKCISSVFKEHLLFVIMINPMTSIEIPVRRWQENILIYVSLAARKLLINIHCYFSHYVGNSFGDKSDASRASDKNLAIDNDRKQTEINLCIRAK